MITFQTSAEAFSRRALRMTLLLAAIPAASAAPQVSNSAPVERYMDASTAVVGWLDISKLDLHAVAEFAASLNPHTSDLKKPEAVRSALAKLGVTRVYWVSDLTGLTGGPQAVIVPVTADNSDAVALVLNAVAGEADGTAVVEPGAVLAGTKQAVAALQTLRTGKPDAGLLAVINELELTHGLAVRTPVTAMMPVVSVLPQIADGDAAEVAKAAELLVTLQYISYSGDLPPVRGRLQLTTKSEESASGLTELINAWTTRRIGKAAESIQMTVRGHTAVNEFETVAEAEATVRSLMELASPARRRAQRTSTRNSLKQIGLAMHNFHDNYKTFPAQALTDADGKRLLSWRVLILPYLDESELYNQFRLDEPWDSEHNTKLIAKMPFVYQSPAGEKPLAPGLTRMMAPLTKNSVFGRRGGAVRLRDIVDGTSNTLLVVEGRPDRAVTWTKPDDLEVDVKAPASSIMNDLAEGFHACMCDGAARFFSRTIDAKALKSLITIDGGETVDWNTIE